MRTAEMLVEIHNEISCSRLMSADDVERNKRLHAMVKQLATDAYAQAIEDAAKVCEPMTAREMRLMAGEMSADTVRSVQSMVAYMQRSIRALAAKATP